MHIDADDVEPGQGDVELRVRIPAEWRSPLERIAAGNDRTVSGEVRAVLRRHIERATP